MKIEFTREQRESAINAIQTYFGEERDEEIGELAAELALRHFVDSIGPIIYNNALTNAQVWFARRVEDMEVDFASLKVSEPHRERRS